MEHEGSLPHSHILPLVPILSPMNPFHTFPSNFFKIHSNIILPSMPSSSKCSLSLTFSRNPVCIFVVLRPAHLTLDNMWLPVKITELLMQFPPFSCSFHSLMPRYVIQNPFSKTSKLRSSLIVIHQVSHTYETSEFTVLFLQGCWKVLIPTRKETSYINRRFWFSYILFIIIIGGILVLFIYI